LVAGSAAVAGGMEIRHLELVICTMASLFFAADHLVTLKRPVLTMARRINGLFFILTAIILGTIAGPLLRHWHCYPAGTGIGDLDRGFCNNPAAPAYTHHAPSIRSVPAWMWAFIVMALVSGIAQVTAWVYVAVHFDHDVSDTFLLDLVEHLKIPPDMAVSKKTRKRFAKWIKAAAKEFRDNVAHDRPMDGLRDILSGKHLQLPAMRAAWLLYTPEAAMFHYGGFMLPHGTVTTVLHWCGYVPALVISAAVYATVLLPHWERECCVSTALATTHSRSEIGSCTDPTSLAARHSDRHGCHTYTPGMIVCIVFLVLSVLGILLGSSMNVAKMYYINQEVKRQTVEGLVARMEKGDPIPADQALRALVEALQHIDVFKPDVVEPKVHEA
jgi:hypothetical protein